MSVGNEYPKLRPVEVRPSSARPGALDLIDSSGIAPHGMTLSGAAAFVVSQMDGRRSRLDIQAEFMRRHGMMLFSDDLDRMIRQLDESLFLHGPRFDEHLAELTRQYRAAPCRALRDHDTLGVPLDRLAASFDEMLAKSERAEPDHGGRLLGLIAPHLDYARGGPCYAAAYRDLARRTDARRFVILGTNHFGLSASVVGTRKGFETPFGVVRHDDEFMKRLDERCGADLCAGEYDHVREHSIELQVILLRHVLGDREFTIAPYLCPDPCGPSGTAPGDGRGVDLKAFATALWAEIEANGVPTCVIAGADLSHVGRYFQDDRPLDADNLHVVEATDRGALDRMISGGPEAFRSCIADAHNATNICSAGCMYALAAALEGRARPKLLHYHQALTREAENCVTCAAIEFVEAALEPATVR